MKLKTVITTPLLALWLLGCSGTTRITPTGSERKYTLPSGNEITITSMNAMSFQNGETALVLNYQTGIPTEDLDELRKEAAEVWPIFEVDVEKANLKIGILRATHIEDGGIFVKNGKGYGFLYKKGPDGNWHLDETKNSLNP